MKEDEPKCSNCGEAPAEAKARCSACRRYLNRTGRDRSQKLVAGVWERRAKWNARQIERAEIRLMIANAERMG